MNKGIYRSTMETNISKIDKFLINLENLYTKPFFAVQYIRNIFTQFPRRRITYM